MNGDRCRALYDYKGSGSELSLIKGDIITIQSIDKEGWFTGLKTVSSGKFPINYTEFIKPEEFIMSIICLSQEERKYNDDIIST